MPNPYAAGGMVTDPKMFFGREDILRTITTRLVKRQSTSVVGQRRIGKSSLLYHLTQISLSEDGRLALVCIDMQRARFHTLEGFFTGVLAELDARTGGAFKFGTVSTCASFEDAVERMNQAKIWPVLLLDEFEKFTDHLDQFDDEFFEQMRALGEAGMVAFVTATQLPLGELTHRFNLTSPFYNIFVQADIGLLEPDAARQLIREPMKREGLKPDKAAVDLALELAGRHPFYLLMAGALIFDALEQGTLDADIIRRKFTSQAEQHWAGLWKHLTDGERAALGWIIGDVPLRPADRTLDALERKGVIERQDEKWKIFSHTFEMAVYDKRVLINVTRPRYVSEPTASPRARAPMPRPANALPQPPDVPPPSVAQVTPPLYAYALVALAGLVVSALISLLLPTDKFWQAFILMSVVLTFSLVGVGKLGGPDFVKWLGGVLKLWK